MFEPTRLSVLEDVDRPTLVCIRLVGGDLTSEPANFEIFSKPGTAQGMYVYTASKILG